MKTYLTCIAAYLTGWVIAHAFYRWLTKQWQKDPHSELSVERRKFIEEQAEAIMEHVEPYVNLRLGPFVKMAQVAGDRLEKARIVYP